MKKRLVKKPPEFPIYLDREEDQCAHMRWLLDQEIAHQKFHDQVMNFLFPHQQELVRKKREWWARRFEHYGIPDGLNVRVVGLGSPMPRLEIVETPKDLQREGIK